MRKIKTWNLLYQTFKDISFFSFNVDIFKPIFLITLKTRLGILKTRVDEILPLKKANSFQFADLDFEPLHIDTH